MIGRVSDDASSQALVSQTTNLGVGRSDRSGCTIKNKALAPSRKKQNMPVPHWCPGWGSGRTCTGRGSSVLRNRFRPPGRVRDCRGLVDRVGNAGQQFANQCSGGAGGGAIRAATCYEACSGFGGKPMRNLCPPVRTAVLKTANGASHMPRYDNHLALSCPWAMEKMECLKAPLAGR